MTERNLDADPTLIRLNKAYSDCIEKIVQDRWDGSVTVSSIIFKFYIYTWKKTAKYNL